MTHHMMRCFAAALVLGLGLAIMGAGVDAQEKDKKEKNPLEGKKGKTIGILVEKGPNFIEVKADGDEKGRRFVPEWKGGAPAQGGGPDKEMVKIFSTLKVGSRLEVEWVFEERLRALKVTVLKQPAEKDKQ
jgi:hypothetical protein